MSALKATAVLALWTSGKFDTADIAHCLAVAEADVDRVLHIAREARRARA